MAAEPIRVRGSSQYVREQAGRRTILNHETLLSLNGNRAVFRATSDDTGVSIAITITDRRAVYGLHQIDEALMRSARQHEHVEPIFKPDRRHGPREPGLPAGYDWCPECLGSPEMAVTCETCDQAGIVRVRDDG